MHVPCTVWRECLAHSVSASPVALTPSVAPNRWHDPHTLASKEGESDVAISLWNGTPLVLHCRGGVAGQRMGSHQEAIHIHIPTIFSPSTKGGGASHSPGTKLPTVSLDTDPRKTSYAWPHCSESADQPGQNVVILLLFHWFSRSQLLNILGNKSNLNFIIPSSALDTEVLDQWYFV